MILYAPHDFPCGRFQDFAGDTNCSIIGFFSGFWPINLFDQTQSISENYDFLLENQ